jgi:uncharacterized membrane protein
MSAFILEIVLVLLIPGIIWSHLLVSPRDGRMDVVERLVLSFGLALVIIPLTAFVLNPFMDIGGDDMPMVVAVITILGLTANVLKMRYGERAMIVLSGLWER